MKTRILLFVLVILVARAGAQDVETMKAINLEVWERFCQAFATLDYKIMDEIHSPELARIPANKGTILYHETYINNYQASYKRAKENGITFNIYLRFFERLNNDTYASRAGDL